MGFSKTVVSRYLADQAPPRAKLRVVEGRHEIRRLVREWATELKVMGRSPKTIEWYRQKFDWYLEHEAGPSRLEGLTAAELKRLLASLQDRGLSPNTIHGFFQVIRSFANWALREGYPVDGGLLKLRPPKVPQQEMEVYSERQLEAVLAAAAPGWARLSVQILLGTGMRVGELVALELEDYEDEGEVAFLKVRRGKGAKFRRVPVSSQLRREIDRYLNRQRPDCDAPGLLVLADGRRPGTMTVEYLFRRTRASDRLSGPRPQVPPHLRDRLPPAGRRDRAAAPDPRPLQLRDGDSVPASGQGGPGQGLRSASSVLKASRSESPKLSRWRQCRRSTTGCRMGQSPSASSLLPSSRWPLGSSSRIRSTASTSAPLTAPLFHTRTQARWKGSSASSAATSAAGIIGSCTAGHGTCLFSSTCSPRPPPRFRRRTKRLRSNDGLTLWPEWRLTPETRPGLGAGMPLVRVAAEVSGITRSGNITTMKRRHSPVGRTVAEVIRRGEAEDGEYRETRARYARAEAVARLLIQLRMKHGLTQEELARLMGTSVPTISRLESGTHVPSLTTLSRLAEAAGEQLVIGFAPVHASTPAEDSTLVLVAAG